LGLVHYAPAKPEPHSAEVFLMPTSIRSLICSGVILISALLLAEPAAALRLSGGVNSADVGLREHGTGLVVGLSQRVSPAVSPWVLDVEVEYVARSGEQPRYFSDPGTGLFLADAQANLKYLQPGLLLGREMSLHPMTVRYYLGASLTIKLAEDWDQPRADSQGDFTYEDTGYMGHLGLAANHGRFWLDARFSYGLKGQLVDRTGFIGAPDHDDATGVTDFEDGARFTAYQITLGVEF
jgi:hypothetical protein